MNTTSPPTEALLEDRVDTDTAVPPIDDPLPDAIGEDDIPVFLPPLVLFPSAPSLVGVEEHSRALVRNLTSLARTRLQGLLARASEAVVSHQRGRSGIDANEIGEEDVSLGMLGFGPAFSWADAEAIWEVEKSKLFARKSRKNDLVGEATLSSHMSRADQFYRDGKLDKARETYQQVEGQAKRTDFTFLITQGNLRLFRLGQPASAQQYYLRAARQLQDKHLYFAAYALLHEALTSFYLGAPDKASKLAGRAVSLMPDFTEARYQLAQYEMLAERPNSALRELTKVIAEDRRYVLKALADQTFSELRGALLEYLAEGVEALNEARQPLLEVGGELIAMLDKPCVANGNAAALHEEMADHLRFMQEGARSSGFLDVHALNKRAKERFREFAESVKAYRSEADEKIEETRTQLRRKKDELRKGAVGKQRVIAVISLVLGLGGCSVVLMDADNPQAVLGAVSVAFGAIVIGGLASIAVPAMAARDEDTRQLAGEIHDAECSNKVLDHVLDKLAVHVKSDADGQWGA